MRQDDPTASRRQQSEQFDDAAGVLSALAGDDAGDGSLDQRELDDSFQSVHSLLSNASGHSSKYSGRGRSGIERKADYADDFADNNNSIRSSKRAHRRRDEPDPYTSYATAASSYAEAARRHRRESTGDFSGGSEDEDEDEDAASESSDDDQPRDLAELQQMSGCTRDFLLLFGQFSDICFIVCSRRSGAVAAAASVRSGREGRPNGRENLPLGVRPLGAHRQVSL